MQQQEERPQLLLRLKKGEIGVAGGPTSNLTSLPCSRPLDCVHLALSFFPCLSVCLSMSFILDDSACGVNHRTTKFKKKRCKSFWKLWIEYLYIIYLYLTIDFTFVCIIRESIMGAWKHHSRWRRFQSVRHTFFSWCASHCARCVSRVLSVLDFASTCLIPILSVIWCYWFLHIPWMPSVEI